MGWQATLCQTPQVVVTTTCQTPATATDPAGRHLAYPHLYQRNNTNVRMMEREEVRHGVGNGLDSGRVGNGLDRGCADIVFDVDRMPTRDVLVFQVLLLLLKAMRRWNIISGIQQHSSSRNRTSSQQWQYRNTTATTATGTRSDNGNGNREMQTIQQRNAGPGPATVL